MALYCSGESCYTQHCYQRCGSKGHGDLDHDLCPQGHLLVIRNIPTKFEGPSPKHCRVISLFCTRGHCELDLCYYVIYRSRPTSHLSLRVLASSIANLFAF